MKELFAQALVIARRDFMSIVGTPTFLIFLLTPLLMITISGASGFGAAKLALDSEGNARTVAIAGGNDADRLLAADVQVRKLYNGGGPARLMVLPQTTTVKQALEDPKYETQGVMVGPLAAPTISFGDGNQRAAAYLAELSERALQSERAGTIDIKPISTPKMVSIKAPAVNVNTRQTVGVGAVFSIFLLTLLLAGQTVGMLAEEKSNKVIEIVAAAIRIEAVFFGKLIGMFGVAMVFIAFWGALILVLLQFVPDTVPLAGYQPAVGLPLFLLMCGVYFAMAFMLLGGVFLGIGAQASTMREIQMMSLPITVFQMAMFGLSSAAAGNPGTTIATFAEWFPFSSPFAMAAHAANDAALWPHIGALAWQMLWVMITIWFAARMFRAGVLKAGGGWAGVFGFRKRVAAP
ncbi:MAG: ABC transporter permease [Sphingomonadaceae bacterium]